MPDREVTKDWAGCLEEFGWLGEIGADELAALRPTGRCLDLDPGSVIYEPDARPGSVFLLREGLARIYRQSRDGDELTLGYVGPQELFGELSGLCDFPRESFARAVTTCRVCEMPQETFDDLLERHPAIAQDVLRMVARRFKRIEARLTQTAIHDTYGRLCAVLHELASDFARPDPAGVRIDVPLTQSDIAALMGAARQTINPLLKRLEDQGILARRRRHLIVLNPRLLEELASY